MKLFYNKNSKDPIYYTQMGIRNGKKITTSNVKRFGKHSELLKITDDPRPMSGRKSGRRKRFCNLISFADKAKIKSQICRFMTDKFA